MIMIVIKPKMKEMSKATCNATDDYVTYTLRYRTPDHSSPSQTHTFGSLQRNFGKRVSLCCTKLAFLRRCRAHGFCECRHNPGHPDKASFRKDTTSRRQRSSRPYSWMASRNRRHPCHQCWLTFVHPVIVSTFLKLLGIASIFTELQRDLLF